MRTTSFLALAVFVLPASSCSDSTQTPPAAGPTPALAEPATIVEEPQWFASTNPNLGLVEVISQKAGVRRFALVTKPFLRKKGSEVPIRQLLIFNESSPRNYTVVWMVVTEP